VLIHIHDISLPQEYPPPWIFDRGQTWNEQYVLQAFLMHNQAYKILIANRYLFCHRQNELENLFQKIQPVYGSSFWMEKRQIQNPLALAATRQNHVASPRPTFAGAPHTSTKNGSPQPVSVPTISPIPRPSASTEFFSRNAEAVSPAPKISDQLQKLEGLMGNYSARTEAWKSLGPEHLMQQLVVGNFQKPVDISAAPASGYVGPDGFPVPPVDLTMGYGAGDLKHYLACGRKSYEILTQLFKNHQVELRAGDSLLDWGGAAGRVVRNFIKEARDGCEIWGCDVHAPSVQWAQNHLSPPFKFFNSSSLPHLPFQENSLKAIYGLSVMTHLITLRDLWLLELRRVLKADGCLILTIHNEDTWAWFRKNGMPNWMPPELRDLPVMPGECVEIRGSRWEHCYTFFHSDYIRRTWGQLLDVKEIVPCADAYQAAVIMKKPSRDTASTITTPAQR
jgi:SAM-dependent methyltransferase